MKYILALLIFISPFSAKALTILAYGDSLTSGYGLTNDQGFVPTLERALRQKGIQAKVINAGIAGDTSADGLARLDWSLADRPDFMLLALGANDALRGLDPDLTRRNLEEIIAKVKGQNIPLLLIGMKAPRNLGADYVEKYDAIFPDLAQKYNLPLYPFFLEGVATAAKYNQPDGLHPNAEGVKFIVQQMLPSITKALPEK